jgi:hypothetical protein
LGQAEFSSVTGGAKQCYSLRSVFSHDMCRNTGLCLYAEQAFQQLVESHKLTNEEELALVASLPIPPQHEWLRLLYRSKCKKYEQSSGMEASLGRLGSAAGRVVCKAPGG